MSTEKRRRKARLRRPYGMTKAAWANWAVQDKKDILKRRRANA
ncbi:hypothetical protein LCGC14_0753040 [marine sediment metagenome]|uniref:Uncharacterized protein n=1 Tax=marine sediment metagenome TaxID=412755 RepID=A0A0F9Q3H3_9ZZZZ